ncbi:MAG TPA: FAD-dependent oxidoreductase [Alphaproteobacteria bacterium]
MPLSVAIIGAGPAGLYCADRLLRDAPGAEIDIIEKLPTPFGLVRAGVAPDHQGTKGVTRVFERLFQRPELAFWGNIEIGRDLSLEEIRATYDAVVIATGALSDRRLGIPGEDLPGVYGSAAFVGWYNGIPAHCGLAPKLDHVRSVVIIGNGNVAIDVARVLAKTPDEMARSDLDPVVEATIASAPLDTIWIVGRRGAADARFSPAELAELGTLARAAPLVDADELPGDVSSPTLDVLRKFSAGTADRPVRIRFRFGLRPERIVGDDRATGVAFRRTVPAQGTSPDECEFVTLPADLVVSCIGYGALACGSCVAENGVIPNVDGRIAEGLYVVGWAKRGPSGTIPTNRTESHAVAQRLVHEVEPAGRPGRQGLAALIRRRGLSPVNWAGWQAIDAQEIARAKQGRVRRKFRDIAEMLRHAGAADRETLTP